MQLSNDVNVVTLTNVGTVGEFRIRNSAKAFSILSSGLYSNKIKAIIRELSCNAVDSHVAAGKADVPFEVHLPTMLEPWFSVQDFGLGLDGDQVTNIYTTYFESTKTDSNDFIGALGLGSKSPFSYTENFTVTAIKDGIKRIYSAFINEMGVPSIAEMNTEPTSEGNGVEVKFSVVNRRDYDSFKHESQNVFKYFKNKPKVTGTAFTHSVVTYTEKDIVPGVHTTNSDYGSSIALMGNICYPLNISEPEKHFPDTHKLLSCGLVIEFNIGELDFAASREELSYVPITIASIKRKLDLLNANLAKHLASKADVIKSEWERAFYLTEQSRTRLYAAAASKYVADTKFPLFDSSQYHGRKTFIFPVAELKARNIDIIGRYVGTSKSHKIGLAQANIKGVYTLATTIPVEKEVVIVLNDLKTGAMARAQYHYSTASYADSNKNIYCISHSSPDLAVRQAEYNKIIKELHNPPVVIMASALKKKEPVKRVALSNRGIMVLKRKADYDRFRRTQDNYMWAPYQEELTSKQTYNYVCLSNVTCTDLTGALYDIKGIKNLIDSSEIEDLTDIQIFGVQKSRVKEISALKNWKWVDNIISAETAKISDAIISTIVASTMLSHYSYEKYISKEVAGKVSAKSPYAAFAKKFAGAKSTNGLDSLVTLCGKYGKTVQVDKIKKSINDELSVMKAKYPLLQHLSGAPSDAIADYVNLVDSK
jgi:hypothetical protein